MLRREVKRVFSDELILGSVRAQVNRLKNVLSQIENDENWQRHSSYYASQVHDIEKSLRKIRKVDFGLVDNGCR